MSHHPLLYSMYLVERHPKVVCAVPYVVVKDSRLETLKANLGNTKVYVCEVEDPVQPKPASMANPLRQMGYVGSRIAPSTRVIANYIREYIPDAVRYVYIPCVEILKHQGGPRAKQSISILIDRVESTIFYIDPMTAFRCTPPGALYIGTMMEAATQVKEALFGGNPAYAKFQWLDFQLAMFTGARRLMDESIRNTGPWRGTPDAGDEYYAPLSAMIAEAIVLYHADMLMLLAQVPKSQPGGRILSWTGFLERFFTKTYRNLEYGSRMYKEYVCYLAGRGSERNPFTREQVAYPKIIPTLLGWRVEVRKAFSDIGIPSAYWINLDEPDPKREKDAIIRGRFYTYIKAMNTKIDSSDAGDEGGGDVVMGD